MTLNRAAHPWKTSLTWLYWLGFGWFSVVLGLLALGVFFLPALWLQGQSSTLLGTLGACALLAGGTGALGLQAGRFLKKQEAFRACEERAALLETDILYQLLARLPNIKGAYVDLHDARDPMWSRDGVWMGEKSPKPMRHLWARARFDRYRDSGWALGWVLMIPWDGERAWHTVRLRPVDRVWSLCIETWQGTLESSAWSEIELPEGAEVAFEETPYGVKRVLTMRDTKGVFLDAIESGQDASKAHGDEEAMRWVQSAFDTLRPVLREDVGIRAKTLSAFRGHVEAPREAHQHASARTVEHVTPNVDPNAAVQWSRAAASARWGERVGFAVTALVIPLCFALSMFSETGHTAVDWLFFVLSCAMPFFAALSMRHTSRLLGLDMVQPQAGYEVRDMRREVVALNASVLSLGDRSVDLSQPFAVTYTRSTRDSKPDSDTYLGVSVVQSGGGTSERIAFRVGVDRSSWWESLPALNANTPELDAESFDAWIAPTLAWYSHLHGVESSVQATHHETEHRVRTL